MAYLVITHDIDVLRAMAHRVMVLQTGQVVEAGSADQVLYQPRHAYTRSLLSAFPDE
jgi:microcin C transport system ATP-binding protein